MPLHALLLLELLTLASRIVHSSVCALEVRAPLLLGPAACFVPSGRLELVVRALGVGHLFPRVLDRGVQGPDRVVALRGGSLLLGLDERGFLVGEMGLGGLDRLARRAQPALVLVLVSRQPARLWLERVLTMPVVLCGFFGVSGARVRALVVLESCPGFRLLFPGVFELVLEVRLPRWVRVP